MTNQVSKVKCLSTQPWSKTIKTRNKMYNMHMYPGDLHRKCTVYSWFCIGILVIIVNNETCEGQKHYLSMATSQQFNLRYFPGAWTLTNKPKIDTNGLVFPRISPIILLLPSQWKHGTEVRSYSYHIVFEGHTISFTETTISLL